MASHQQFDSGETMRLPYPSYEVGHEAAFASYEDRHHYQSLVGWMGHPTQQLEYLGHWVVEQHLLAEAGNTSAITTFENRTPLAEWIHALEQALGYARQVEQHTCTWEADDYKCGKPVEDYCCICGRHRAIS